MPKGQKFCENCKRYISSRAYKKHHAQCLIDNPPKKRYTNPMLENRINRNLTAMGRRKKFR